MVMELEKGMGKGETNMAAEKKDTYNRKERVVSVVFACLCLLEPVSLAGKAGTMFSALDPHTITN